MGTRMRLGYSRRWAVGFDEFVLTCVMPGTEERGHVKMDLGRSWVLAVMVKTQEGAGG